MAVTKRHKHEVINLLKSVMICDSWKAALYDKSVTTFKSFDKIPTSDLSY